jgi:hypothetical protein
MTLGTCKPHYTALQKHCICGSGLKEKQILLNIGKKKEINHVCHPTREYFSIYLKSY